MIKTLGYWGYFLHPLFPYNCGPSTKLHNQKVITILSRFSKKIEYYVGKM